MSTDAAPAPAPAPAASRAQSALKIARLAAMYGFAVRLTRSLTTVSAPKAFQDVATTTTTTTAYADVCRNLWRRDEVVDVRVHALAEDYEASSVNFHAETPLWGTTAPLASATRDVELDLGVALVDAVARNVSVKLHAIVSRLGASLDPADEGYDDGDVLRVSFDATIWRRRRVARRRKLLGEDSARAEPREDGTEGLEDGMEYYQAYYKPNATLTVVDDFAAYRGATIPDILARRMRFSDERRSGYYPTVYFNEFWIIKSHLRELNETSAREMKINLNLETISQFRWQMEESMEQTWSTQRAFGAAGEHDADNMKRVFLEGNPTLLAVTTVVSLLHTIFDFFAFKHDVQFWRNRKSLEGLSARSVLLNAFCQLVIFLYLCDNETSWMILISSGLGVVIEFWKVTRAMDVSVDRDGRFPRLRVADKASALKSDTARHDADAMRYLSYALYPLVGVYAVYSLRTHEHKGWWSFVLSTLVGAVYTFGFISMTPQLYVNYKLKSVAAMPWKQMGYKFLNTIIDDLFAFVIKMPTLHRISVFRDDVIFLLFLYQRRVYRVDETRANEFGYVADAGAEDESKKDDATENESKKER